MDVAVVDVAVVDVAVVVEFMVCVCVDGGGSGGLDLRYGVCCWLLREDGCDVIGSLGMFLKRVSNLELEHPFHIICSVLIGIIAFPLLLRPSRFG